MERVMLDNKTILVTGAAGFIGSNLVKRLFKDVKGATIIGIDNMNDYYDVALKEYRLNELNTTIPGSLSRVILPTNRPLTASLRSISRRSL